MNDSNFQLLQEATQNMATPREEYGQEDDSAEDSNPSVDLDEGDAQDEAEADTEEPSVTQSASQIPSTHTPNRPVNAEMLKHVETIPIEDPELQEALRQLQAGEHIPDKTPTPVSAGDGTREVRRRAVYTREQKLAAVHFSNNTFRTAPDGTRRLISGPEAAQLLNCSWTVLGQWIKDADKIQSMDPGAQKQRWARRQSAKVSRRRSPFRQDRYSRMRNDQHVQQHQQHALPNGTSAATRDELRKMVMYQDPSNPRKAPPPASQSWGQPPFHTPGVAYGAPTPARRGPPAANYAIRGYGGAPVAGGWGSQGGSLVSYEVPWASARRVVQQVCSTIDAASQCQGSDVQFTTVAGSKVMDSTLINCNVSSSDIGRNASIYQSTLVAAKIADDADIACSTIKSSIVRNATLTNCTVTNCRITGGRHFGKTFENRSIDGTEKEEPVVSNKRPRIDPAPKAAAAPAPMPDTSTTAAAEVDMADADGITDEDEDEAEAD